MLGPRTRSADQRAPRAEQLEPNENSNDDGRETKRSKNGERALAPPEVPASAAMLALAATNLYAITIAITSIPQCCFICKASIEINDFHR